MTSVKRACQPPVVLNDGVKHASPVHEGLFHVCGRSCPSQSCMPSSAPVYVASAQWPVSVVCGCLPATSLANNLPCCSGLRHGWGAALHRDQLCNRVFTSCDPGGLHSFRFSWRQHTDQLPRPPASRADTACPSSHHPSEGQCLIVCKLDCNRGYSRRRSKCINVFERLVMASSASSDTFG